MAEEEQGFTFVDKRRSAPNESATPVQEAAARPADEDDEGSPDIYSVIGYCLSILAGEAWQKMGLVADPKTGEASPDLPQAKVAVDAVGDLAARLEAAPAEFVPESSRRELRTLLNDLRLNYVAQHNRHGGIVSP